MSSFFGRLRRGGGNGEQGPPDDRTSPRLPDIDSFAGGSGGRVYRVTRTVSDKDPRTGARVFRSGVGVSDLSEAQAEMEARDNAQRLLENALAGRESALGAYAYHADKRLEPYVESVRSASGEVARVTVNGYGSLVMNASAAMFVDVDTGDEVADPKVSAFPAGLPDFVSRRPDLGFRVYRTLAGWRYLCTTTDFDPASDEVRTLLAELGSDEKYIVLCRVQKTFRARLTPKPWRARQRPLDVGTRGVDRGTLQQLIDKTWKFATARYVGSVGSAATSEDIRPLIDYHDAWTQALGKKPLA